jgi:hypothetical protein
MWNCFGLTAQEKEPKLFLTGYIKNLHEFSFIDNLDELQWTTFLHNRLNFKYTPTEEIKIRLELRNRIYYGDGINNIPGFSTIIGQDNGVVDLSCNLVNNTIVFNSMIDRAMVNYIKGDWDISLGRQRINWGMNVTWNPNDIFNTYNFLDFDYEERPGSDAIRVQYYVNDFSKIEVAAKKGKNKEDYIFATMYKFNKWSYDVQLLTGIYQKDWVIGVGWAGNLKNTGFKGEVSYFVPFKKYENSKNIVSASLSVDYGFKEGLYVNGSLLYNSNANEIDNLESLQYANVSAKNLMPYKYAGLLQLSKEFTPILSGTLNIIYGTKNQSVIAMPSLNYSLATNWELNFTGQSFFEFNPYKTLGNTLFMRLRYSF